MAPGALALSGNHAYMLKSVEQKPGQPRNWNINFGFTSNFSYKLISHVNILSAK